MFLNNVLLVASILVCQYTKKSLSSYLERLFFWRGTKQIRTAVDGFADRCLTTRPWYPLWDFPFADAKVQHYLELATLFFAFFARRCVFSSFSLFFALFLLLFESAIATGSTMLAWILFTIHRLQRADEVVDCSCSGH